MVAVYVIGRQPEIGTEGCQVLARTYGSKTNKNIGHFSST